MSEFLKKFKSIFIVEEPAKPGKEAASAAPSNTEPAQGSATATPETSGAGSVSDRFLEILAGALEKNNQPGFDYFEFRQSLANLSQMPMDEATRFKSAFAMAQTMGVNQAKLVESAQFYIQILNGEQSKFNEAHVAQRAKLIGNREEEMAQLTQAVQQKTQQIEELTRQIEEHRQRVELIKNEIGDSTLKIERTKADFEATFSSVVGQLQDDITKIKQYL